MLKVEDLSLAYGSSILMDRVSFCLVPGRIYGLVAPNGYGKTTLLKALAGVPGATVRGCIAVDDIAPRSQAARRARVFYAPGEGTLLYPGMTAREHLQMARDLWGSTRSIDDVAAVTHIEGFLKKRVRSLSQGMKQQLTLAIAYTTGARYLLLDEPMNALDPTNVSINSRILHGMASRGTCVLMSSHILDNVDHMSDSILFVKDKGLYEYVPEQAALRSGDSLERPGQHGCATGDGFARTSGADFTHPLRIGNPGERAIDIYNRFYIS